MHTETGSDIVESEILPEADEDVLSDHLPSFETSKHNICVEIDGK